MCSSYLVPFSPFGAATISRALAPGIIEYLLQLSKADGADRTRANDAGADQPCNGEPNGELGMGIQNGLRLAGTDVRPRFRDQNSRQWLLQKPSNSRHLPAASMTVSAVKPWRIALREERCLPVLLFGPVLFSALQRFSRNLRPQRA